MTVFLNCPEASCRHEHKTLEAVCPSCGKNGDAFCPHCHAEYHPDSLVEDYGFRPSTAQELLKKMGDFASWVMTKRNTKFWWECYLIATGSAAADGRSMTGVAKEWGVSKATVSKHCVMICARLGVIPSRAMLSEEARNKYKLTNRRNAK